MTKIDKEAPKYAHIKRTSGYEANWWGTVTDEFDELAVEYIRADILEAKDDEIAWLREALERIERLAGLVAHDLVGRVEGGKVEAVQQCSNIARAALAEDDTP
jgi:hypothetical protein